MTTKSYRTWRDRLLAKSVTHPQANQFCKAIWTQANGYAKGGHACAVTRTEAEDLVELLAETKPIVMDTRLGYNHPEQTTYQIARDWLKRMAKRAPYIPDLPWDEIVEFAFVDCHVHDERYWNGSYYADVRPVYEARWADGRTFRYSPSPWQAKAKGSPAFTAWWTSDEYAA